MIQIYYLNQQDGTVAISPVETPDSYYPQCGCQFETLELAQAHAQTTAGIGQSFQDEEGQWSELIQA